MASRLQCSLRKGWMMIVRLPAMGRIHHTLGCMPKNTFMRALKNSARSTKHVPVYIPVFAGHEAKSVRMGSNQDYSLAARTAASLARGSPFASIAALHNQAAPGAPAASALDDLHHLPPQHCFTASHCAACELKLLWYP